MKPFAYVGGGKGEIRMTPRISKAARALLGLSAAQAADGMEGIKVSAFRNFEAEIVKGQRITTIRAIEDFYRSQGVGWSEADGRTTVWIEGRDDET